MRPVYSAQHLVLSRAKATTPSARRTICDIILVTVFNASLRGREEVLDAGRRSSLQSLLPLVASFASLAAGSPAVSVVMDADRMGRTLTRIAHEILERNRDVGDLALVGIRTRGVPIARRLARAIHDINRHE